jgi:hypothetical protein
LTVLHLSERRAFALYIPTRFLDRIRVYAIGKSK